MLISQLKAIRLLKAKTGLSIASSTNIVRGLPKTPDGAREKINTADLERAIATVTRPKLGRATV